MSDAPTQRARRRLAARLLHVPASRLTVRDVPGLDATFVCEPVRGGVSLVVGSDGSVLYGGSSTHPAEFYIEEFRKGRRTPMGSFEGRHQRPRP